MSSSRSFYKNCKSAILTEEAPRSPRRGPAGQVEGRPHRGADCRRGRDRPAAARLLKNFGRLIACWMIVGSVLADAGGRRPVGAASMTGIGNFLLAAAAIHPGRDRATPTTPFEIGGATQVWHSSARYAPFRARAFPSSLPCRSRCRALAGLVRAQTSDDIRPRALCTPPPKSFARSPRTLHPANAATGITVWSASFAPGIHFETKSDLCATAYCAAGPPSTSRAIASWISYDFEARSTSPNGQKGRIMAAG